ncbi:2-oxoglutarate dehydrogenase, E2 component, dihydrolipoamide succinyltransferase, partial [Streptomyces sp. NPDC006324]
MTTPDTLAAPVPAPAPVSAPTPASPAPLADASARLLDELAPLLAAESPREGAAPDRGPVAAERFRGAPIET